MKVKFILLALCCVAVLNVSAQDDYRLEISWGMGFSSVGGSLYSNYRDRVISDEYWYGECGCTSLNIFCEYNYNITDRLSVGMVFGGGQGSAYAEKEFIDESVLQTMGIAQQEEGMNCWASWDYYMPSVRYKWYRSKSNKFRLYSQVALGYAVMDKQSSRRLRQGYDVGEDVLAYITKEIDNGSETTHHFAYQVTPVAIEVGRNHWRWFCEIGYGYKGTLTTGVRYSFYKKERK